MKTSIRIRQAAAVAWLAMSLSVARAAGSATDADAPPPSAPRLPTEAFARLPAIGHVTFSPDGTRIAAVLNRDDGSIVVTRRIGTNEAQTAFQSDNTEFHINDARWVSNDRLLVSVRLDGRREQRGRTGRRMGTQTLRTVATIETRLYAVKADGSGLMNLVRIKPNPSGQFNEARTPQFQAEVIDWLPGDGHHVLLQLADEGAGLPAVYEVDVDAATRKLVHPAEPNVRRWLTDAQHRVRVAVRNLPQGDTDVRASDPDGSNWRTLWSFKTGAADAVTPLGFGADPQELYVRAMRDGGGTAVYTVRLDDAALPRTLKLEGAMAHPGSALLRDGDGREVLGLRALSDAGDSRAAAGSVWNPAWRELMQSIDHGLPGRVNQLVDVSQDKTHYVVYSSPEARPGEFYLGDRQSGRLDFLASTYPALSNAASPARHDERIAAHDGRRIEVSITRPTRLRDGEAAPMVVIPEPGGGIRNRYDFDHWAAFLADRGYAVLQLRPGASTSGLQRSGTQTQDDLADALQWAQKQGGVDAKRVCIVGAGDGGHAALMGLVKSPDRYRCGVSIAAATDLSGFLLEQSSYRGGLVAAERMVGLPASDRERLRALSPALQAASIRAPVLLVHGTEDRLMPFDQGQEMADALRKADKPYRFIEQEGGDHGLDDYPRRLQFFTELERFLDENLKAAAAPQ